MAWFSILPEGLAFIETWLIRLFLFLGFVAIGPWVLLIVYDVFLYLFRTATYEVPYVGGRARNRPRPRAPSLTQRPNGKKRSASLPIPPAKAAEVLEDTVDELKRRTNNQKENSHRRNISLES